MPPARALVLASALASVLARESAAAAAPREARAPSRYAERGLLGPVRLGPVVGVGFPDGLQLGVVTRGWGWVTLGASAGWVPEAKIPIGGEDTRVTRVSGEAFARVHPFRGGFFLGAGLGAMQMKGQLFAEDEAFGQSVDTRARAFVASVYATPQLGYLWMFGRHMTASIEVGLHVPLLPGEPTFDARSMGLVRPIDGTGRLADAMRVAVQSPVPMVNLLKLGVLL